MDFPKKQAQRLMPLYLLEYSEKLFENHPDPEAPWGGEGSEYTAGYGIDITWDNKIQVDTDVIARRSDLSNKVTTDTNQTISGLKRFNNQVYIMDNDNIAIVLDPAGIWINQRDAINQRASMSIQVDRDSGDPLFTWGKEATAIHKVYKLPHTDLPGNHNYILATTEDIPSLTNYVTTTQLEDALDDYALTTDIPTDVSQLNNDAGYTTQTWVENQGYSKFSGSYNDLTDKPTIPTVNDPTITFVQGSTIKGTIHLNQSENSSIVFDAGGTGTVAWDDITNKPTFSTVATSGSYNDLSDKPTIPTNYVTTDTAQTVTGFKTFSAGHLSVERSSPVRTKLTFKPDMFVYSAGNGQAYFKLPTSKPKGTTDAPTEYTLATTDDIPDSPFLKVDDPQDQMFFSLDGSDSSWYKYVDLSASNRLFYVNLSALNPVFKNGLISTYNNQTHQLEVELNAVIPTVNNDLITIELISNSGTLSAAELYYITNSKEKVIIYGRYSGYNYYQAQYQSSTASTATYASEPYNGTPVGGSLTNSQVIVTIDTTTGAYTVSSQDTGVALKQNLATVATSGSYNDLSNKPTIPDAVSGTNDGTNWTSLTVGNDTYAIPQGGSAPGMIGEVLFSSASGSTDLTLTMAHSFADYSYIDIQWINNDGITNSTRVYEPNGKRISVINMFGYNPGTAEYINKAGIYDLSGTSMTQVCKIQGTIRNRSNSGVDYKSSSTIDALIKITKVIGYKQNSAPIVIPDFEYHNGDTYVNSHYINSTGYITNSQKEITFTIIVPKLLTNITSVTVNKLQGLLRGVSGYVNGFSDIDYASASGYTINTYIGAPNAVTISILKSSAHSGSTNNTPINLAFAINGLQLTFNE